MNEEEYVVDACGGPYYNSGEDIRKGEVLGKDENGDEVVSQISGQVCSVDFDGRKHCFNVRVKQQKAS